MIQITKSLPYQYYFTPILIFNIFGILISSYLLLSHYYNYTQPAYASFCAITETINCDTVAQSHWSVFANIPVALWGVFGYTTFLLLLIPLSRNHVDYIPLWSLSLTLGFIFSLASLFFAFISTYKIHSICILCFISYIISFGLFFQSWLIYRRYNIDPFFTSAKKAFTILYSKKIIYFPFIIIFFLFCLTILNLPHYWSFEESEFSKEIATGTTEKGHPWIGARKPTIIIEEFSDYQCFQCFKMHFLIRRLISEYPNRIRLVHRHYPLDHQFNPTVVPESFHIGAGKMSLLAVYASTQNKFWEMNDILFKYGRSKESISTKNISMLTGIPVGELNASLSDPTIRKQLDLDIWTGMKLRITTTPTFRIEGKLYPGTIPENVLESITQINL